MLRSRSQNEDDLQDLVFGKNPFKNILLGRPFLTPLQNEAPSVFLYNLTAC